jgi:hypothetical protein
MSLLRHPSLQTASSSTRSFRVWANAVNACMFLKQSWTKCGAYSASLREQPRRTGPSQTTISRASVQSTNHYTHWATPVDWNAKIVLQISHCTKITWLIVRQGNSKAVVVLIHCGRVWESRSEKAFILGFRTAEGREVGRSIMPIIVKKQWRIFGNQNMAANRYTVARTGNRSCYSPAVHFEILNIKRRTLVRACVRAWSPNRDV